MSFLKSLKGLADNFMDKDKQKQGSSHSNDSHNQPQPQQSYTQDSSFLQQQHQHSGLPPQQGYGAPPSGPHLPPGWIQQWDQNSQRYYYLEQATGRTQWGLPTVHPPAVDQHRGFAAPSGQQYGYDQGYAQQQGYGNPPQKSNKNGMLAAGAGGLLVGGLAGSALSGDSDHDRSYAQGGYGAPPAGDPEALEHNSNVSSSQRSSLEEAREDYEEAQRKAADSDASSSDREEAQEAREEYREEIEEAQEEAYDD